MDVIKDENTGEILALHCTYDPASRGGGTEDAETRERFALASPYASLPISFISLLFSLIKRTSSEAAGQEELARPSHCALAGSGDSSTTGSSAIALGTEPDSVASSRPMR